MPYKDPDKERAGGRRRYERITAERLSRGMCPRCGEARPVADHSLCQCCGEKRRQAERARCAKARAAGILYAGRDAERCRRSASDRSKRRDRARREAGLCTRCAKQQPVEGGTVCEPCREARGEREREQYAARRAAGECGRCGAPAPDGSARCERCAGSAAKPSRKKAKNARGRRRYVRRRVRGVNASGNNMPRGVQLASAADAVRPPPTAARVANGAPGARPNPQGRRRRTPEAAGVTSGAGCEGFA